MSETAHSADVSPEDIGDPVLRVIAEHLVAEKKALVLRAKKLTEDENALTERSKKLDERDSSLDARKKLLSEQKKALDERRKNLDLKERFLVEYIEAIDEGRDITKEPESKEERANRVALIKALLKRQNEIKESEAKLKEKENEIAIKEAALTKQEHEIGVQQTALQKTRDEIAAERQALDETRAAIEEGPVRTPRSVSRTSLYVATLIAAALAAGGSVIATNAFMKTDPVTSAPVKPVKKADKSTRTIEVAPDNEVTFHLVSSDFKEFTVEGTRAITVEPKYRNGDTHRIQSLIITRGSHKYRVDVEHGGITKTGADTWDAMGHYIKGSNE